MPALQILYVDDEPHMRQLVAEAFAESSIRARARCGKREGGTGVPRP